MSSLYDELTQQPQALRELVAFYRGQGAALLRQAVSPLPPLLTGMGASYHAAWIAALHFNCYSIPARSMEAVDLLNYATSRILQTSTVIYISQSGTSGEVPPLLDLLSKDAALLAVTNNPRSLLSRRARLTLPELGGVETLVASKTYLNTLALLWLLVRRWSGVWSGNEFSQIEEVIQRLEEILAGAQSTAARLVETFDRLDTLLFLGHGPHAATARQAAMMMSEWSKVPALSCGIGAFRHGFIETVQPGMGVVVFSSPTRTGASAQALAGELADLGATVLLIENGCLRGWGETCPTLDGVDEFLSPILDIVPVQFFTEALARHRNLPPGFRYIGKVVQQL